MSLVYGRSPFKIINISTTLLSGDGLLYISIPPVDFAGTPSSEVV
ncbi:MAG TPA: hypothetical protein VGO68_10995 [Pyrinomonadaceae bacterium]|nr:hypothetical protein [Pyrinomonadaceae bacterium]